jgi:hypothetical protein
MYKIKNNCIIYPVPGAMLILTELHNVMQQIPELQVRVAAVPGTEGKHNSRWRPLNSSGGGGCSWNRRKTQFKMAPIKQLGGYRLFMEQKENTIQDGAH